MDESSILNINQKIYFLFKKLFIENWRGHNPIILIENIEQLAYFAFKNNSGIYIDTAIEELLFDMSLDVKKSIENNKVQFLVDNGAFKGKRKILHIVSNFYVGGHIALLKRLICLDSENYHFVVFTRENGGNTDAIKKSFIQQNTSVCCLEKSADVFEKAISLRDFAQSNSFDCIFLHHNPNDSIPSIAFATEDIPPVTVVNHADHAFWLGSNIADFVIDIRNEGREITVNRRSVDNSVILPLPIVVNKEIGTVVMGDDKDKIIAVAMASAYKFKNNLDYDFFRTWVCLLDEIPNLILKIIGITPEDIPAEYRSHKQIEAMGVIQNPENIIKSADFAVDSMPIGSYTSLLEICAYGSYPIFTYNPIKLFDLSLDLSFNSELSSPHNENEYIEKVKELCGNIKSTRQKTIKIQESILNIHSGNFWFDKYSEILNLVCDGKHKINHNEVGFISNSIDDNRMAELFYDEKNYSLMLNYIYTKCSQINITDFFMLYKLVRLNNGVFRDYLSMIKKRCIFDN